MTRVVTILILATICVMSAPVQKSLGPPAPITRTIAWCAGDSNQSFFRVYTSQNLFNWEVMTETTNLFAQFTCDQSGPHFYAVKAVNAYGESDWGTKEKCQ